ncbi:hypothetical protein [Intrasporangium sp.]|uniref:hypothetical protein n=1 Tax=Intrasporangium sp. TaxID=1925024 RepID=UPI00293A4EC2|nr:hypothetical protein [Intrasporangium sp.]MDV3221468.1 hypothetical protein [Intrasporangium sp.]
MPAPHGRRTRGQRRLPHADLTYSGTEHRLVTGQGILSAKLSWLGGQAAFGGTVRW